MTVADKLRLMNNSEEVLAALKDLLGLAEDSRNVIFACYQQDGEVKEPYIDFVLQHWDASIARAHGAIRAAEKTGPVRIK